MFLYTNSADFERYFCICGIFLISTITLGISLQAMDTSHVALVSLNLSMEGFEEYRCDSNGVLGVNIANLSKVRKLADPSDSITLQAD